MKPENIEDIYTLSPTQEGMLFHILANPDIGMYIEQILCTLCGKLNISAFERAWQQILDRHPSLRSTFIYKNLDKPHQVVHRQVRLVIEQYDWCNLSILEQEQQLNAFMQADLKHGFQLSQPPLMRLTLIRVGEETYQLIWSFYHLILDGWCTDILLKELFALYKALCEGHNLQLQPSRPYQDYITWLKQQDLSGAETFWRQTLKGFKKPTPIGIDHSSIPLSDEGESYGQQQIQLSEITTTALKSLAKQHHLTLNTLFMGSWALLLSYYSQQKDVLFGTVVSGRPVTLPGVETIVGLFVNTLPTRVQVSLQDSLVLWLKALQSQHNQLRQYEYTPLVNIQHWSEVTKELPLFESLLACQNSLVDISQIQTKSLKVDNVRFFSRSNYPLNIILVLGSKLELVAHYDLRSFKTTAIKRILGHFKAVLNSMVAEPYPQLGSLINLINELDKKEKYLEMEALKYSSASKLKGIKPKAINLYHTNDY